MGRLFTVTVLNALALWLTSEFLAVFTVVPFAGEAPYNSIFSFLLLGLFLGIINAILMPIVKIATLPLYIVTLGLWALVVNGISLWILRLISDAIGWGVRVENFWWDAVWAALVLALVNWFVSAIASALGVKAK